MKNLDLVTLNNFVNENIVHFHDKRLECLKKLDLKRLLKKNPYLFKAKNLNTAGELVASLLEAFLSSSEEKLFGDFLETLAIFVANNQFSGHKSTAQGIDLEIIRNNTHFIISIKSGSNWGNAAQHKKLESDFGNAIKVLKQSHLNINVQPILGICYGKTKTSIVRNYLKLVGQNFWYFISGDKELYIDIIEPIGYRAKEHNEEFLINKAKLINIFTKNFIEEFCFHDGSINWNKLVEFNSGNFDLKNQFKF